MKWLDEYIQLASHDAFRYGGGLNKSAAEIYWFLLTEPMTVSQIAARSGRNKRTIYRVLSRMANLVDISTGEIVPMIHKEGREWCALDVDLDRVAQIVGTFGDGERQHIRHRMEQRLHRRALEAGRRRSDQ
jgi:DNA-binding transcriptional regulator LsrR (DeoR family)